MEILITLAAAGWSATDKILQTAVKCERSEVEAVVASLCAGAGPRATAAAARRQVEAKAAAISAQAGNGSGSGGTPGTSKSTPLPMSTEAFAVRVLTRLTDEFPEAENRLGALRVLEAAIKMEQEKLFQPSNSSAEGSTGGEDGAAASTSAASPAAASTTTTPGAAAAVPPAAASAAPTASNSRGGKPVVMPELGLSGGSKLLEKDGDEAAEMGRHTGGRGGGINCPCCNPDDPQFMVDKMLMM